MSGKRAERLPSVFVKNEGGEEWRAGKGKKGEMTFTVETKAKARGGEL